MASEKETMEERSVALAELLRARGSKLLKSEHIADWAEIIAQVLHHERELALQESEKLTGQHKALFEAGGEDCEPEALALDTLQKAIAALREAKS